MLKIGEEQAKQGWPENQARDQLAHHGRLAKAQHGFAEQTTDHHQHNDLTNENCFGCALAALGGPGRPSRQNGQSAGDSLHDRSDAPGKAGRMSQASSGTFACTAPGRPTTATCRPSLDCESQVPDNWKGFQMFRQQMQLQTICNWLY